MKRILFILSALVLLGASFSAAAGTRPLATISAPPGCEACGSQQDPRLVRRFVMWRVPHTWPDAIAGAEVIAVVRIEQLDDEVRVDVHSSAEYVRTRYTAAPSEILKGDPTRLGDRIEIVRGGGVMDEGGERVRHYDPKFPEYEVGGDYVVFLNWDDFNEGYTPYAGPALTYQLDRSAQRVISSAHTLGPEDADTPATFLSFLRSQLRR